MMLKGRAYITQLRCSQGVGALEATVSLPAQSFSRSIVFLLDRSGSMTGKPLQYARQALDRALTGLGPSDQLNIIAYDHEQVACWPYATMRPQDMRNMYPDLLHAHILRAEDCRNAHNRCCAACHGPPVHQQQCSTHICAGGRLLRARRVTPQSQGRIFVRKRRSAGGPACRKCARRPSRRRGSGCAARTSTRAA